MNVGIDQGATSDAACHHCGQARKETNVIQSLCVSFVRVAPENLISLRKVAGKITWPITFAAFQNEH